MAANDPRFVAIRYELAALYLYRIRVEAGLRDGRYESSEPVDVGVIDPREHVALYHTARLVAKLQSEIWRIDQVEAVECVLREAIEKLPDEPINPDKTQVTWPQLATRIYILGKMERRVDQGHFATALQRQAFSTEPDELYALNKNSREYWMKEMRRKLTEVLHNLEAEFDAKQTLSKSPPDNPPHVDPFVAYSSGAVSGAVVTRRAEAGADVQSAKRRYRPFRRPEPRPRPHSEARISALDSLEAAATRRCNDEWEILRLANKYPMPVHWELTDLALADSLYNVFGDDEEPTFDVRSDRPVDLAEQFLGLDRQRLVILGEPGAGKSVLVHVLQWQLLARRSWVIPVLLTISSWDVEKFPKLRDWLVFRLTQDFPDVWGAGRRGISVIEQLVDSSNVLPILDGLDEVAPQALTRIWSALNDYSPRDALVLACRTDRYVQIVEALDVVKNAAVIEGRKLSGIDAITYLVDAMTTRQLPRWLAVFAVLQSQVETPLREVGVHPLGLWLIRTVYIDTDEREFDREILADPNELLDRTMYPTAFALKNHLFANLIPTVLRRRTAQRDGRDPLRPRRTWNSTKTQRWLNYVAVELSGTSDIRWWQLPYRARVLGRFVPKLEEPGRTTALGRSPIPFIARRFRYYSTLVDLGVGLFAGILIALLAGVSSASYYRFIDERLPDSIAQRVLVGAVVGCGVGIVAGLAIAGFGGFKDWLLLSHDHYPSISDPECPACIVDERNRHRWRNPMSSYRDSRKRAIVTGVGSAVGIFVSYEIVSWIWKLSRSTLGELMPSPDIVSTLDDFTSMAIGAVIVGIVLFALVVAVVVEPAWFVFFISSKWLALRGKLPWRTLAFLDDAHRLGLLRASGAVYEFRHAELRDYLERCSGGPCGP